MTNHQTRECYYRPRGENKGKARQPSGGVLAATNRARPVLGSQPPLPSATHVRYVEVEEAMPCYAIVPATPYYAEELSYGYEYDEGHDSNLPLMLMGTEQGCMPDAYAIREPL